MIKDNIFLNKSIHIKNRIKIILYINDKNLFYKFFINWSLILFILFFQ